MSNIAEKLTQVAENMPLVKEAGIAHERKRFWDIYQDYGKRTNYQNAFYMYTEDIFHPIYPIKPTGSGMNMFNNCKIKRDMVEYFAELGIEFDTSGITNYTQVFSSSFFTRIGVVDMSKATATNSCFATWTTPFLEQIDKVIVAETTGYSGTFSYQTKLKEIRFEGVIGQNGVNFQWSTLLSKESLISIINALSSTTTGLTVTLSKTAVNNAFGINVDDASTYTDEWNNLRKSKSNWTFNFA